MEKLYAFSLIAGFLFSLFLFLSGGRIRLFHIRIRILRHRNQSPASPMISGMFLTMFGLAGLLTHSLWIALMIGCLAALLASLGVAETAAQLEGNLLYGQTGHVSLAIPESGIGRIAFNANGKRVTLPAKATHAIEKGKRIYVRSMEGKIAIVDEF